MLNGPCFTLFLAVLVLAPLPLGSNREWSWNLLVASLAGISLLWALGAVLRPGRISASLNPVLILGFLVVCAWAALQAWPGAPAAWHHPLWALDAEVLGESLAGSISLAPDDTWTALLRLAAYGLSFFLAFQLCRDPRRARRLLQVLVGIGLVGAVYGLAVYWSQSDRFLYFWTLNHRAIVRGTFVNANHFATWVGLCLMCLLALSYQAVTRPRRNPAYTIPGGKDEVFEAFLSRAWKYLAILLVLVAALILSRSRGGFGATFLASVVFLLCVRHRGRSVGVRVKTLVISALVVGGAVFILTSEVLLSQIDATPDDLRFRMNAYELAADGVEDSPVLGFGYGSFEQSFKLYRDDSINGLVDKAHNTYLENLFELGWPAALVLFACVAWLALICLHGVRTRGRDWVYPATGLAATTLVATHSLVDFSLQIPAVAVTYTALMGAACAQSHSTRGS